MANTIIICTTVLLIYFLHSVVAHAKNEDMAKIQLARVAYLNHVAEIFSDNIEKFENDTEIFDKLIKAYSDAKVTIDELEED